MAALVNGPRKEGTPIRQFARRLRRLLLPAALTTLSVAAVAAPVLAADVRNGGELTVEDLIDDDVYAAGRTVLVTGAVTGDVLAAGGSVAISGSAGGSFNAAAQQVGLGGQIAGSARVAARRIDVTGSVGGDLLAAGSTVAIDREAIIGRDLLVTGQSVEVAGRVVRQIRGGAAQLTVSGVAAGVDVTVERLVVAEGARIEGDLVYRSDTPAVVEDGAVITGRVVQRAPPPAPNPFGARLKSILGTMLLGGVLLWLTPPLLPAASRALKESTLAAMGAGLAGLIVIPILLALLLGLAVIAGVGGALLVVLGAGFGVLLILAQTFTGYAIGLVVLSRSEVDPRDDFRRALLCLLLGVVIIGIVSAIPYVGAVILAVVAVSGFGAGLTAFLRWRRASRSLGFAVASS